ncbi:MAG: hypothetical protein R3C62_04075 [Chloroflexota bacterium]
MRGLVDRKGEQFAYLVDGVLYTMEGEKSGRLEGNFVVDLAGNPVWRVVGDGVYTLKGMEPVGFFTGERSRL